MMGPARQSSASLLALAADPPQPRALERTYCEVAYYLSGEEPVLLPLPAQVEVPFFSTLAARRTRRNFGHLGQAQLSSLLWFSARTLTTARSSGTRPETQCRWEHRVTPSAG